MRTREYPVLADEDCELIARLAIGTSDGTARVLGYLLLRDRQPAFAAAPATRLEIQIGTGESRNAVSAALNALDERDLVIASTVERDGRGRPPKAWRPRADVPATVERVYSHHAADLLTQAAAVAAETGAEDVRPGDGSEQSGGDGSLTVGLNWRPNVLHAPLFAAVEGGDYEDRGMTVGIRSFEGSGRALDALRAGEADVVVAGAATTVRTRAGGAPLVPLAPLFQRAMAVLYTTRDAFGGPLDGVERLRGRRIGMPRSSETGLLVRLFLSQSGLLDETTVVDVGGEERAALRSRRADVVTGTFADPRTLEADGTTVDVLPIADHFPIYGPTLVTTEGTLRERYDDLERFLAGTLAGRETVLADPGEAVRAVVGSSASPDALERGRRDLTDAVSEFGSSKAVRNRGWGWHTVEEWRRLNTALGHAGLLDVP
ncbi:ABC transporter substrate-binding protein [Halomarina halobia]|uniref:ABC transporter substrate-binding protein n=1 Tax=Halomarina halobia TaxID=3033386 RepID=A0ABD6A7R1_9EURY|nr:ABC transporter substrate-binding protein [Halomarina sp. PSR21]